MGLKLAYNHSIVVAVVRSYLVVVIITVRSSIPRSHRTLNPLKTSDLSNPTRRLLAQQGLQAHYS